MALGTPAYMAPEQASADPHLDHRLDIYAVGTMGYELLTGRPPFSGGSSQQVLAAHIAQQPEPVSARRPAVPPALAAVVMRCLEKRPADRYQTADELLVQLEPLATHSGGTTPTQTRPVETVPAKRARFRSKAALAVGVAAVLLAAAVFAWTRQTGKPASVAPASVADTAQLLAVLPFESIGGDTSQRTSPPG